MNLFLLKLLVRIQGKQIRFARLLGCALFGALGYCIVLCLPGLSYAQKVLAGMLPVGMLMVKFSCQTHGLRELLYGTGYLFTVSFLVGGFILFLKNQVPWLQKYGSSVPVLVGMGTLAFVIGKKVIKFLENKNKNPICQVILPGDNGPMSLRALIDTGNRLREPISQKPVAILSRKEWAHMSKWQKAEKYKVIPFHSIGKKSGTLEGYEIGEMEVKGVRYEKVIIAISTEDVSLEGQYQMILPPELSL